MAAALAVLIAAAPSAVAQNLVVDPYFTKGVPANQSTDSAGNTYYISQATPLTLGGLTGIRLNGQGYGYFYVYPVGGYNTNGVTYVLSFLAAAINPAVSSPIFGALRDSNGLNVSVGPVETGSSLTQYSVTGTSSPSNGNTANFYVQAYGGGDVFVTGLDLEPAPLSPAGSGVLSLAALLAGLAVHRFRRRQTA